MTQNTIIAGDATTPGIVNAGGNDGTLVVQVGPTGAKKTAISINAAGVVSKPQNVVAFSAGRSTNQTVPSGVITKVQLDTKLFDSTSAFDNVTNYRFQPTVSGYYQINGTVNCAPSTGQKRVIAFIYKNGSLYTQGDDVAVTNPGCGSASVTTTVYLNGSTDFVELFGYVGNATIAVLGSGLSYTQMSGFLIQPA